MRQPMSTVFLCVGISIQTKIDSHFDKTRPVAMKVWPCPFFNEQDQITKLRASIQQAGRRKLTASIMMVFVSIARLCSKQWAAFNTFVPVTNLVRSLTEEVDQRGFKKREISMN